MKSAFQIALFFICFNTTAQQWLKIQGTEIEFSNFTEQEHANGSEVPFEYFRFNKKVIGVSKEVARPFYMMFRNSPMAFDSVFNNLRYKTTNSIDRLSFRFDKRLLKIDYSEAAIVSSMKVIEGDNEIIWRLKNYTWSASVRNPCYTQIVFTINHSTEHDFDSMKFHSANYLHCEY